MMDVAILGMGGMGGTVVSHLRQCPLVQRIVGHDIDAGRLEAARAKHGIETFADLNSVLADKTIPLVFITASNSGHKDLALRSVAAGKAVMCEKPLATTLADARQIVEAVERRGTFFQVGFELRYSRLYTRVKQWIDEGLLGRVINTHCLYMVCEYWGNQSWRVDSELTGGMFAEKLCHYVDLPRWWVGDEWVRVRSVCAPNVVPYFQVRDNYHTTYEFADGGVSHLTYVMGPPASFHGDPLLNVVDQQRGDGHALRYQVFGTEGFAEADVFTRSIKRWRYTKTPQQFESRMEEELTWPADDDHVYFHNTLDQAHDIVRRVQEGQPPKTSAADAFESMALTFAAEQSATENGRIIGRDEVAAATWAPPKIPRLQPAAG